MKLILDVNNTIINKTNLVLDNWLNSPDFFAYRKYTGADVFRKINKLLRLGESDNDLFSIKLYIDSLDKLFALMPKEIKPAQDLQVFRCASMTEELRNIINKTAKTDIYLDKGFVSTSLDFNVAKKFMYNENDIIFQIKIPKGSSVINDTMLPKRSRSLKIEEKEVLLPRNAEFKILSFNPETKIVEAEYLGQKMPLPKINSSTFDSIYAYDKMYYMKNLNNENL